MAVLADGRPSDMRPWTSARLAAAYQDAATAFAACRYHDAAVALTAVTAAARTTSTAATGNARDFADAVLIRSYALVSELGVKAGDDQVARASADRAFTLASALGDPALLGIAARISVRNALGDPAGALRAARLIQPGTLPTRERSARYGLDVARAWHQQGRDDHALRALIEAESHGPEDVRRPSVRALVTTIATAPRPPAGAREFAARTGALL